MLEPNKFDDLSQEKVLNEANWTDFGIYGEKLSNFCIEIDLVLRLHIIQHPL